MLRSMTGFGRGTATAEQATVVIELKGVNNRYQETHVRIPREYNALESRLKSAIADRIRRGRVDLHLSRQGAGGQTEVRTDRELADSLRAAAEAVVGNCDPVWLLNQPGVLTLAEAQVDADAEWPVVESALSEALDAFVAMRNAEGRALEADLRGHLTTLADIVADVAGQTDHLLELEAERIRKRVGDIFGVSVDPDRLVQEAAILAERGDVAEELSRMDSHIAQFRSILDSGDAAGRKLSFLLQEMLREINTLGSKSASSEVRHQVVEMKSLLEKLREQSANVE